MVYGVLKRLGDTLAPLALLSVGMQLRLGHIAEHKRNLAMAWYSNSYSHRWRSTCFMCNAGRARADYPGHVIRGSHAVDDHCRHRGQRA